MDPTGEPQGEVTGMLNRWASGDASVLPLLADALYPQWRRMAQAHFYREDSGHVLQPTALVHEAYLALARLRPQGFASRNELHALVAKLMRQILVDHARRVHAAKRGGGMAHVPVSDELDAADETAVERASRFLIIHQALGKLEEFHRRMASIIELHFFGGLTQSEIGESLGISTATVNRELRMAKAWLNSAVSVPLPEES
jgi:RNA polymerase sigma-70 factor (ECF subfamily)